MKFETSMFWEVFLDIILKKTSIKLLKNQTLIDKRNLIKKGFIFIAWIITCIFQCLSLVERLFISPKKYLFIIKSLMTSTIVAPIKLQPHAPGELGFLLRYSLFLLIIISTKLSFLTIPYLFPLGSCLLWECMMIFIMQISN